MFLEECAFWKGGDFVWCKQDGFSKSSRYLLFYSSFSSNHPGAKSLVRHGIESILFPNKPLPLLLWDSYSMVLYLDFPNSTAWRYRWAAGWAGSARASRWVSSPPPPPPRTLCLRIIVGCVYIYRYCERQPWRRLTMFHTFLKKTLKYLLEAFGENIMLRYINCSATTMHVLDLTEIRFRSGN